jgi:uncharacterized protein (TIGR03083 family)
VDVAEHLSALRQHGQEVVGIVGRSDADTPVPTCPGWRLRDLAQHLGGVHRWAAWHVAGPSTRPMPEETEIVVMRSWPAADHALAAWLGDGLHALVTTLESAPPDVACWSFLPAPSPLAFWARRQAHETAIHCADAQSAAGAITPVDPAFAADGIDELLHGFFARKGRLRAASTVTLHIHAVDHDGEWMVRIGPDGTVTTHEHGRADCAVRGTASDLYHLLWNRRSADGLEVFGNRSVLQLWQERARVTWS